MTYTQLAVLAVLAAVVADSLVLRTGLIRRRLFWTSYAILFGFQLLTNGVLTGQAVVRYDSEAIIGQATPQTGSPPFLGDGRIAFAPVEDLLFGFGLILITLSCWVWLGRSGIQREPTAGPPRWRGSGRAAAPADRTGSGDERRGGRGDGE